MLAHISGKGMFAIMALTTLRRKELHGHYGVRHEERAEQLRARKCQIKGLKRGKGRIAPQDVLNLIFPSFPLFPMQKTPEKIGHLLVPGSLLLSDAS